MKKAILHLWAVGLLSGLSALPLQAQTINITSAPYNASTGSADNAAAIQAAINAVGSGGTVLVPAGTFLSGPLTLKSNMTFQVASGAILRMTAMGTFPATSDFLYGSGLTNITINGSGTMDGQGAAWWSAFNANSSTTRPSAMIYLSGCNGVTVTGITVKDSPMFHIQFLGNGTNIYAAGLSITAAWPSPNTDGIDLRGKNVLIENCYVSDGDDVIQLGGSQATSGVTIRNCTFGTGHGLSVGGYTQGGVSNVLVTNCTFNGTQYGLRWKSGRDRGGLNTNLTYSNITMSNILVYPLYLTSWYPNSLPPSSDTAAPISATTPYWANMTFQNITASGGSTAKGPAIFWAVPEAPVSNVLFDAVTLSSAGGSTTFDIHHARGVTFDCNCRVNGQQPPTNIGSYDATILYPACGPTNTFTSTPTRTNSPTNTPMAATNTATLTRTNTWTATPTNTAAATATPTPTTTRTNSPTNTPTSTDTNSATATATLSRTNTPANTPTPTATNSPTATRTNTPVNTLTATPSSTPSGTSTSTATNSSTPTRTNTPLNTPTNSATGTATNTPANTSTLTATNTATKTNTSSTTTTATSTPTNSSTSTSTPSRTSTPTITSTPTLTPTGTAPPTNTPTSSATNSMTSTASLTGTPTASRTATSTPTTTATSSSTSTASSTPTSTSTNTGSMTATPSLTATASPSPTSTPTFTSTSTRTPSATASSTSSNTPTMSATNSATSTATTTVTHTPSASATESGTSTATLTTTSSTTASATPSPTSSASATPTKTPTASSTATHSMTPTPSLTATNTPSATLPPTLTATETPKPVSTLVIAPNPVDGPSVNILAPWTTGSGARVEIFTVSFRKVLDETFQNLQPGVPVPLELKNRWGNPLADGVYYVVVTTDKGRFIGKLMVLR